MMRRTFQTLIVILVVLTSQWVAATDANAKLNVVATLPDLGAVAQVVGDGHVNVQVMISPNQDPHFADARPSLTLMLNKADLLIANGLELEVGWLPPLQNNARNPKIQVGGEGYLEASSLVDLLEVPTQRIDRSMGDVHPGGNPHFVLDPNRMAKFALGLGKRLAALDPENAEAYAKNAQDFAKKARLLAAAQHKRFMALPKAKRQVVAYHASLVYLASWLGLNVVFHVEPRPGIPPTPGHVAKVLSRMKSAKITVILQEVYYPKSTSQTLTKLVKGRVVSIPGGPKADESYLSRMQRTADDVFGALNP